MGCAAVSRCRRRLHRLQHLSRHVMDRSLPLLERFIPTAGLINCLQRE